MDSSLFPNVTKPLQETHCMSLDRLIVFINRIRQALLCRVPTMRARLLFERFPGRLLRVLFGRVMREANDPNPPLPLKPLLDFLMHEVRCRIQPYHDPAAWALLKHHLKPSNRRVRILKVYRQGRDLRARPKMHCSVDVLGILASGCITDPRLMTTPTPPLADRPFQIDSRLVARERDQTLTRRGKFFENLKSFHLEAELIFECAPVVEGPPALQREVEQAKNLAHTALRVAYRKTLLNQMDDSANGPPTAHLRARHSFLVEQRTEPGQLL